MYITHELFPPYGRRSSFTSPLSHNHWITVTDAPNTNEQLGKRKRQIDTQEGSPFLHETTTSVQQQVLPQNRGMRRMQGLNHASSDTNNRSFRSSSTYSPSGNRPQKHIKLSPPKPTLHKLPSHLMDAELEQPLLAAVAPLPPISASALRPCHICHSAPKRKKELENYLQCQSCAEQACYICARECSGGCQKQLCSKCCVEVGEEGDTYCLDCYSRSVNSG